MNSRWTEITRPHPLQGFVALSAPGSLRLIIGIEVCTASLVLFPYMSPQTVGSRLNGDEFIHLCVHISASFTAPAHAIDTFRHLKRVFAQRTSSIFYSCIFKAASVLICWIWAEQLARPNISWDYNTVPWNQSVCVQSIIFIDEAQLCPDKFSDRETSGDVIYFGDAEHVKQQNQYTSRKTSSPLHQYQGQEFIFNTTNTRKFVKAGESGGGGGGLSCNISLLLIHINIWILIVQKNPVGWMFTEAEQCLS